MLQNFLPHLSYVATYFWRVFQCMFCLSHFSNKKATFLLEMQDFISQY